MKHEWPIILTSAAIILGTIVSCSGTPVSTTSTATSPITSFTTTPAPTQNARSTPLPYQLTVIHTSENHGHWDPIVAANVSQGGIARRATLVKQLRAENVNTILLDSGDLSQGTLYYNQYRGTEGRDFYNALGYDAIVPGNHDFDGGPRLLADNVLDGAKFSVVASNMDFSGEPALAGKIDPNVVKTVGGQRIGIFGLVTEEVVVTSSPGPNVKMINTVQSARDAVALLSQTGVDKIILLSHLGFDADQILARKVPGIDIIVSGHTETLMGDPSSVDASLGKPTTPYPTVVYLADGSKTLIVHDFIWGRELGLINVTFEDGRVTSWSGDPILVGSDVTEDPATAQTLSDIAKPLNELKKQVIARTTVNLDGKKSTVRNIESNMGDLIADAVLWTTARDGAKIALVNGGGIRASIPAGDITIGQIMETLPFGNRLVQFDINGSDLAAALENGLSALETDPEKSGGRFLQVSGISFSADLSKPAGARVIEIQIGTVASGFQAIDPAATYRIVTLDYMLSGGDGFTMFKNGRNVHGGDLPEEQAVIEYLKANPSVNQQLEARIALIK